MAMGKQTQFSGLAATWLKLLYAINGGIDEITGNRLGWKRGLSGDVLDYDEVMRRFKLQMQWLAELYVNTMNTIHFMHDRYSYERVQMASHDTQIHYFMSFGIAGLSVSRFIERHSLCPG